MSEVQESAVVAEGTFTTEAAEAPKEPAEGAAVPPKVEEPPKPENDKFAAKFAALTRKEKEIRERERQMNARMAELEKKAKEYEERSKTSASLEEELRTTPLKVLREKYGYDFEKLAEMQLNDENPTYDMKLDKRTKEIEEKALSRIEQLEKALAEKERKAAESQVEAVKTQFKNAIKAEVDGNAETYELVQANEAYDLVFDVIENFYNDTAEYDEAGNMTAPGKILSVKDAAEHVEKHLEEEAKKILKLKKFQKQTSPTKEPVKKETAPTLSNDLASESPKNGRKFMSDEESKAEAAKLIRWQE